MKIEILNEKENPLLKRREFEVKVTHDAATPSISEIRKKIAASKDIGKGTIIIDSFKSKYGSRETLGTVKVYQTKERALKIEPRHRLIKNELIEITEEKPAKEPLEKPAEKPKKEPKKAEEEAKKSGGDAQKSEEEPSEKPKEEEPEKKEEGAVDKKAKAKPEAKKKGKKKGE